MSKETIKCTDDNIKQIVKEQIKLLGNEADLNHLDVSNVADMSGMFVSSEFNGDISKWDVSSVTNMSYMFQAAHKFNGAISKWDVSSVTNMSYMFADAKNFNRYISKWDVSNVTTMDGMFRVASKFNGDISKWDTSNVTTMSYMFSYAAKFSGDISKWDTSKVTAMFDMFEEAPFSDDMREWAEKKHENLVKCQVNEAPNDRSLAQEWGVAKGFDKNTVHKETIERLCQAYPDDELGILRKARINKELGPELESGHQYAWGWQFGLGALFYSYVILRIFMAINNWPTVWHDMIMYVMFAMIWVVVIGVGGWILLVTITMWMFNRRYTHTIKLTVPEMIDKGGLERQKQYRYVNGEEVFIGSKDVRIINYQESGRVVEKSFKVIEPRMNKSMAWAIPGLVIPSVLIGMLLIFTPLSWVDFFKELFSYFAVN